MLLRIEIIVFFLSFFYMGFYGYEYILGLYKSKKIQKKERLERRKKRSEDIQMQQKLNAKQEKSTATQKKSETSQDSRITPEQSEKIRSIINRAELNISRGYIESARSLIVEGLALKKEDRALNNLLAQSYELEKKYENAKYIYEDLLELYGPDEALYEKLGSIYLRLGDNEQAVKNYKNALEKNRSNQAILLILTELYFEQEEYQLAINYANRLLKDKPRDIKALTIKGYSLEHLNKPKEARETYEKVLEVQPYNSEVHDRVRALSS